MAKKLILQGVKVADFSWVITGPTITAELAAHGAQVIFVESHLHLEVTRLMAPFKDSKPSLDSAATHAIMSPGKYGISLDLAKPKGQEIARQLVKWADIACESMAPGNMAKLGLDYESCRKIKPDIIYLSACQFGQRGPLARYAGYGPLGAGYNGFSYVLGQPGKAPQTVLNSYPDFVFPPCAIATLVAALLYRRRTGKGVYLDGAQVEAGVRMEGPAVLDYVANGRIAEPLGSRDPYMAPHGVYPCQGNDRWLAITVSNEEEWQAFVRAMGEPDWCQGPKFSSIVARKENEDELDSWIARWTEGYTAQQAMQLLQDAGVPAGIVATGEDLLNDPQLKYREHFVFLEHKAIGRHAYHAPAYHLSKTPHHMWKAAPCLGEDNLHVYKEVLGFSEEQISDLMAESVITTEADLKPIVAYR